MYLGFRAENSVLVSDVVKEFVHPHGTVSSITHMWLYGNVEAFQLDDVFVIKTDGFIEFICKYMLGIFLCFIFLGFLINNFTLVYINVPFVVLAIFILLPDIHLKPIYGELKNLGYTGKFLGLNYFEARARYLYAVRNYKDFKG